jgi:hypothetical protein
MTSPAVPLTKELSKSRSRRAYIVRIVAVLFALTIIMVAANLLVVWPWMQTWGATEAEIGASLPGDDIVADATLRTTKAITINAPPEAIYPWLLQIGVDRGGMYSYDWLENIFGLDVHTAERIVPAWQEVQTGDFWRFTPEDYALNPGPGLYVQELLENEAVLLCFGLEGQQEENCIDSWQFVLVPQENGSTRLLLRSNMAIKPQLPIKLTYTIQFIMERKMLLTLRDRAQRLTNGALLDE